MKIDNPEKIYKDDDIHINQDKPLDAERTIREQQKLLAQKNAQLKQEKDKRIQLEKLLWERLLKTSDFITFRKLNKILCTTSCIIHC